MNIFEFMSSSPWLSFFIFMITTQFIYEIIKLFTKASVNKAKYKEGK